MTWGGKILVISYHNNKFILKCDKKFERIARDHKFFFDPIENYFYTPSVKLAKRLEEFFDETAKNKINSVSCVKTEWPFGFSFLEGLKAVQIEAVVRCLEHNHYYVAFEQRLGKTPVAISVLNNLYVNDESGNFQAVIVVPPFLVSNWLKELNVWAHPSLNFNLVTNGKAEIRNSKGHTVHIVSDSLLINQTIIGQLKAHKYNLFIGDEWHRMNNGDSGRSRAVYGEDGLLSRCEKVVLLSGTPARSRPFDLFPVLSNLAHNTIDYRSKSSFAFRYCDARLVEIAYYKRGERISKEILEVKGSSNEEELAKNLRPFMMVEKFKDHFTVNDEETITLIDGNHSAKVTKMEELVLKKTPLEDLVGSDTMGDIATLRRLLTEHKLEASIEYILNALESGEEKILVFGIHVEFLKEVHEQLSKKYKGFIINGETPMKERTKIQKEFQEGKYDFGVANIFTMSGIDLSAASRNIFLESSWTPADNQQAKFRIYSRDQKKHLFTEHLVLADTLDEYVLRRVLEKQKTINRFIKPKMKGKK